MKSVFYILVFFMAFCFVSCTSNSDKIVNRQNNFSFKGNIQVVYDAQYATLITKWINDFRINYPAVTFTCLTKKENPFGAQIKTTGTLGILNEQAFYSEKIHYWRVAIARDALLPITNCRNPYLKQILAKGFSKDVITKLFAQNTEMTWGEVCGNDSKEKITVYLPATDASKTTLARFIGKSPAGLNGILVENEDELLKKVENDVYAITFCGLSRAFDLNTGQKTEQIEIIPIDRNVNGKTDYVENNFSDLNTFLRAMWIGKYPGALSQNIYVVATVKPSNAQELQFIKWILTNGQSQVAETGLGKLVSAELPGKLSMLN